MTAPLGGGAADTIQVAVVPDFSRFPAELRRGVDQAMREFTARVDQVMGGVERSVADTGRELGRDFQIGGEIAEQAFRELDATARRELNNIDRQVAAAATGMGTRFQTAAALAGAAVLGAGVVVGAGLALVTGMGLKAAASMEQTQIAFNALLGSAEEGKKVFQDLQQFAALTPFQLTEITPVAQRFFTFAEALGLSKQQVKEFLTVVGDLASVTGSGAFGMERVAFAMAQISSKGRLAAQDVNQIGDALPGFNVRAAIAAELGLSVAEAMEQMENGAIDADTGLRVLMEGMRKFPGAAGAMQAQSQTLLGVWSTFKDTFNLALVESFTPVIPGIKQTLSDITPVLGEAMAGLAPLLGEALMGLLAIAGPLVKGLSAALMPIIDALSTSFEGMAESGVLERLGLALAELFETLGPSIPLLVEFTVALAEAAIPLLLLLAVVLRPLTPLLDLFARSIHELNRALAMIDWAGVGRAIGGFFTDLWADITGFFTDVVDGAKALPEAMTQTFQDLVDIGARKILELVELVRGLPGRILNAVTGLGDLLVDKGADLVRGLWRGIIGMGGWLIDRIKAFVRTNITDAISSVLGIGSPSRVMADQVGRWIPAGIGMGVQEGMPALRSLLAGVGTRVPADMGASSGGAGTSVVFGPGAVVVQFSGAVPTSRQALDTGIKVGQGIMEAINRRGVATAVKQHA